MENTIAVVVPNWNGADMVGRAIKGLCTQSKKHTIIVVDNGSTDDSLELLRPLAKQKNIVLIEHAKNTGFTGAVNAGINYALSHNFWAVALLNNDAVPEKDWLQHLAERLESNPKIGIVTCKLLSADGKTIDSTGDQLSTWGLPHARGRDEQTSDTYDQNNRILAASGGASLYRCVMFKQIGLFDQDYFAYYEDIDISLRARLQAWEVYFEPRAVAYHQTGSTSGRIKGFTTYQTMKNLPMLILKNLPTRLLLPMIPRFSLAYTMFFGRAITDGRGWPALKGWLMSLVLLPKNLIHRLRIQRHRTIEPAELDELLLHDLPPNATKLRALRSFWQRLRGKS